MHKLRYFTVGLSIYIIKQHKNKTKKKIQKHFLSETGSSEKVRIITLYVSLLES